jgi:pimeloyl-ACP methyl ester carboxylesterase
MKRSRGTASNGGQHGQVVDIEGSQLVVHHEAAGLREVEHEGCREGGGWNAGLVVYGGWKRKRGCALLQCSGTGGAGRVVGLPFRPESPVAIRRPVVSQHAPKRDHVRAHRRNRRRTGAAGWVVPAVAAAGALAVAALVNARSARRAEERHPPVGRFMEVDGVRMHVAAWGEGPPVVLVHGNGTMVEDYVLSGLVDRLLDDGYRVIALDRPGYGHSDRPRDRIWDAYAQADLVARTLAELGVERPVVVGHSWGAIVAAALAIKHENSLSGIVLLSGYYFPTGRMDVWVMSPPAIPVVGDLLRYTISPPLGRFVVAPALIRRVFEPLPPPERFLDRFPLDLALRPSQVRASAGDSALMVPSAMAMQDHYRHLSLPVAILTGDGDAIVTPEHHSMRLHGELPASTLTVLPGLGHMIHYHAQDRIAEAVQRILDREQPTRAPARPRPHAAHA